MEPKKLVEVMNILLVGATCGVSMAHVVPMLRPFLKYGKTLDKGDALPTYVGVYVPKRWFLHFYQLHVALSCMSFFLVWVVGEKGWNDLHVLTLFNLLQSSRRLYECNNVSKFSAHAKMHLTHYLVGLFFYSAINIYPLCWALGGDGHRVPFTRIILASLVFAVAYNDQMMNHWLLSRQKKYFLPKERLFTVVVCPHYLDEIVIYLSFLIVRPGLAYLVVSAWVITNLSISANQSWMFYLKQGDIKQNHYRVIPFIY